MSTITKLGLIDDDFIDPVIDILTIPEDLNSITVNGLTSNYRQIKYQQIYKLTKPIDTPSGMLNVKSSTAGDIVFLTDWNFDIKPITPLEDGINFMFPSQPQLGNGWNLNQNPRVYKAYGKGIIPIGAVNGGYMSVKNIPFDSVSEENPIYFFMTGWGNNNFNIWSTAAASMMVPSDKTNDIREF